MTAVEGIEAALDQLTAATCVASSGTHEKMKLTLGLTGLYERFAGRIFSTTEVEQGKPAPDLFLHAAGRLTPPSWLEGPHTIVFSDMADLPGLLGAA